MPVTTTAAMVAVREWVRCWARGETARLATAMRTAVGDAEAPEWAHAQRQGVMGVLLNAAAAAGLALSPKLQNWRRTARAVEMRTAAEVRTALTALHAAGIPAAPIKGWALIGSVYPLGGWREIADVDVIVPFPVQPAIRALRGVGFRYKTPDPHINAFNASRDGVHAVLVCGPSHDPRLAIELHHHLYSDMAETAAADVLAHAHPAECAITCAPIYRVDFTDQFLIVCHHLMLDLDRRLKWWLDVDRIVRQWPLDPTAVARRAVQWGDPLSPLMALGGAAELVGTPIPTEIWTALCAVLRRHERTVIRRAAAESAAVGGGDGGGGDGGGGYAVANKLAILSALKADRGLGRRHRSLRRLIFPSPAEVANIIGCPSTTAPDFPLRRFTYTLDRLLRLLPRFPRR